MDSTEKRAVIFDLDGTLIDSDPDIRAALNRVVAADGLAPLSTAEVQSMIGDGAKVLLERAFAARGSQAEPRHLAAFLADYEVNSVVETVPYQGIVAALEALAAAGLGIPSIFVTWGYGQAQGSHTAHKPQELPGLIAQMG